MRCHGVLVPLWHSFSPEVPQVEAGCRAGLDGGGSPGHQGYSALTAAAEPIDSLFGSEPGACLTFLPCVSPFPSRFWKSFMSATWATLGLGMGQVGFAGSLLPWWETPSHRALCGPETLFPVLAKSVTRSPNPAVFSVGVGLDSVLWGITKCGGHRCNFLFPVQCLVLVHVNLVTVGSAWR